MKNAHRGSEQVTDARREPESSLVLAGAKYGINSEMCKEKRKKVRRGGQKKRGNAKKEYENKYFFAKSLQDNIQIHTFAPC